MQINKLSLLLLSSLSLAGAAGCVTTKGPVDAVASDALSVQKDLDAFVYDLGLGTPVGQEVALKTGELEKRYERKWKGETKSRISRLVRNPGALHIRSVEVNTPEVQITLDGSAIDAAYTFKLKGILTLEADAGDRTLLEFQNGGLLFLDVKRSCEKSGESSEHCKSVADEVAKSSQKENSLGSSLGALRSVSLGEFGPSVSVPEPVLYLAGYYRTRFDKFEGIDEGEVASGTAGAAATYFDFAGGTVKMTKEKNGTKTFTARILENEEEKQVRVCVQTPELKYSCR